MHLYQVGNIFHFIGVQQRLQRNATRNGMNWNLKPLMGHTIVIRISTVRRKVRLLLKKIMTMVTLCKKIIFHLKKSLNIPKELTHQFKNTAAAQRKLSWSSYRNPKNKQMQMAKQQNGVKKNNKVRIRNMCT